MKEPPSRTVLAVDGATVLGSATMGPNGPGRGAHIATGSFMVDPRRRTRGVGRALGEHVVDWAPTVPGAFDHPEHGYVGPHGMFLDLMAA